MMMRTRRGISEVIATLMLLSITAAGSLFLANLMQGSGFGSMGANTASPVSPTYAVKLIGYDTRDSTGLLDAPTLENRFDKKLCTQSCSALADSIPQNGGTEFIAVQIKNVSTNSFYIKSIQISGITHVWDEQTWGVHLDASSDDSSGKYPQNGKFSIVTSSWLQKSSNEIFPDEEVILVAKLSKDITPDIQLARPLQVLVDFGSIRATEFVVMSGDAK